MSVGEFLKVHKEVYSTTDENSFWVDILTNPGLFHAYNCYSQLDNARGWSVARLPKQSHNRAVVVESRNIPYIEYLIRKYIYLLSNESLGGDPWSHTIVCTDNNVEMVKKICGEIHPHIQIFNLGSKTVDQNLYNELFLDINFWYNIQGEKILVWQPDTEINHGNIQPFLKYDWIGAPWPEGHNDNSVGVGNGGLSLRSKSAMLKCLQQIHPKDLKLNSNTLDYMTELEYLGKPMINPPEDVYFSKTMIDHSLGNVAPKHVAEVFSNESTYHEQSFGEHQVWRYKYSKLFNRNKFNRYCLYDDWIMNNNLGHNTDGWFDVIDYMTTTGVIDHTSSGHGTIQLLDCVERHFMWRNKGPVVRKWVGIIHTTPNTPGYLSNVDIEQLLHNECFQDSLPYCQGIVVLTKYLAKYLRKRLPEHIKVDAVKHPTTIDSIQHSYNHDRFIDNLEPKVVQIGQQMRMLSTIYRIHTNRPRLWLTGVRDSRKVYRQLLSEIKHFNIDIQQLEFNDVVVDYIEDRSQYLNIVTNNIVVLNMIDASANNAVLELLARDVPFFINKLPPIVEYLGEDYPMYYDDIKTVESYINQRIELNDLFLKTHRYLQSIDKNSVRLCTFTGRMLHFINK